MAGAVYPELPPYNESDARRSGVYATHVEPTAPGLRQSPPPSYCSDAPSYTPHEEETKQQGRKNRRTSRYIGYRATAGTHTTANHNQRANVSRNHDTTYCHSDQQATTSDNMESTPLVRDTILKYESLLRQSQRNKWLAIGGVVMFILVVPLTALLSIYLGRCKVECDDGKCVKSGQFCDGIRHCDDGTDERKCHAKFLNLPEDQIVRVGDDVHLRCEATVGSDILQWFYTTGDQETVLWDSNHRSDLVPGYRVDCSVYSRSYDLVIQDIKVLQGLLKFGVRFAHSLEQHMTEITVTDAWTCNPGSAGLETVEGDLMNLTASINYWGSLRPPIHWYSDGQQLVTDNHLITHKDYVTTSVSFTRTATPDLDNTHYNAFAFNISGADSPHPPQSYLAKCKTFITVLYGPHNMALTYHINHTDCPDGLVLSGGSVISCDATSKPPPTFSWRCDDGNASGNSKLVVRPHRHKQVSCTCTASNEIRSKTHTETTTLKFLVCRGESIRSPLSCLHMLLVIVVINTVSKYTCIV